MRKTAVLFGVLVALVAVSPALAQGNSFKIFAAASYVSPLSEEDVTIEAIEDSIGAASEVGWELGFEWRMAELLGLELSYLDATHDVDFAGETIGDVQMSPINAALNFHLINTKFIDFYVAPAVAYVSWGDLEFTDGTSAATDSEFAYGAALGLDIGFGKTFAITAGLRYLLMDLPTEDGDVGVDPLFARVGVAFRF